MQDILPTISGKNGSKISCVCAEPLRKRMIAKLSVHILSARTDNRPDFQRMGKDSTKKLFDTVIVWKLDRFACNRYESAPYILSGNQKPFFSSFPLISISNHHIFMLAFINRSKACLFICVYRLCSIVFPYHIFYQ